MPFFVNDYIKVQVDGRVDKDAGQGRRICNKVLEKDLGVSPLMIPVDQFFVRSLWGHG